MKKLVTIFSVSTLALAPVFTIPALADGDMTARAYFSYKFGSGESLKNTTRYGFQFNRSWDNGDDVIDPFAAPRSLTVFDFATDGEGLAKANVLGLDTIAVYDIWTGKNRLNQNAGGVFGANQNTLIIGGLIAGGVLACVVFDVWPCDDDNNNPPPPPD